MKRAFLIHPVPVGQGRLSIGDVSVSMLTFDLSSNPTVAADDLVRILHEVFDAEPAAQG